MMRLNPIFYQLGLSSGTSTPTPDYGGTYVMHPEVELVYNMKGSMELSRPEKTYPLSEGSLIIYWGMVPYTIQKVSHQNSSVYITFPLEDFANEKCLQTLYHLITQPLVLYFPKVSPDFSLLFTRWSQELRETSALKSAALLEIKGFLYRWNYLLEKESANTLVRLALDESVFSIQKMFIYLFKNISKPLKEEEMARDLKIHTKTLRRQFHRVTGMTLRKYVMNYRMNQAMNLIQKNKRSTSFIWSQLGFQSCMSFYRNFKTYFGHPPDYFRAPKKRLRG